MAERFEDERAATLAEAVLRARQMALILAIPSGSFSGREPEAYAVMSHLYAMPRLPQQGDRHRLANEILPFANKLFPFDQPDSTLFFSAVQGVVITMQEFPAWYAELAVPDEKLVDQYIVIKWTLRGMELALGVSSLSPASAGQKALSKLAEVCAQIEAKQACVAWHGRRPSV